MCNEIRINSLCGVKKLFSSVRVLGLAVLAAQVLGNLFRREFGLANVSKIPRQVDGLSCKQKSYTLL